MNFEGILIINKPEKMTSYDVIRKLKPHLQKTKIGHAGTLDPFATGVLIVAVGKKYTKTLSKYQDLNKTYLFKIQLGETTSTLDPDSDISETHPVPADLTEEKINTILTTFQGESEQLPPNFSAKKVNGTRAYKLARAGKEVELKPAKITIESIKLIHFSKETNQLECEIVCSKGTYVRSLSRDIAQKCNTVGYTLSLQRNAIGSYTINKAQNLDTLLKSLPPQT
jgi:tRNA pseudouridine55 synthase